MADSSLYAGDRTGTNVRILKVGRVGFDVGTTDPGSNAYTGTFKTERISPAGPGGLVNFRRVVVHLLASGAYTMTIKTFVDDVQTTLGDGTLQVTSITNTLSGFSEKSEEVKLAAVGSFIQVEITVVSNSITGVFLIESISARGRKIRVSAGRTGETT